MLKLIYFKGCPNAKRLEYLLDKLGRKFKSIEQSDLPKGHPFRKYSSPTLLCDQKIVFGSPIEGEEGISVITLDEGVGGEVEGKGSHPMIEYRLVYK